MKPTNTVKASEVDNGRIVPSLSLTAPQPQPNQDGLSCARPRYLQLAAAPAVRTLPRPYVATPEKHKAVHTHGRCLAEVHAETCVPPPVTLSGLNYPSGAVILSPQRAAH